MEQSEGDPKPFYTRRNADSTRDEYVLMAGGSEVLHRHVTPYPHHSSGVHVRHVQTWDADEFDGENVPAGARQAFQKIRKALQKLRDASNVRLT